MAEQASILMISPFPSSLIKLDDGNYFIWKSQVLPVFKGHRFVKFIEFSTFEESIGEDHQSSKSISPKVYTEGEFSQEKENWYVQDQFLVGWLKGNLSHTISGHFVDKRTTFKLWHAIESRYATKSQN